MQITLLEEVDGLSSLGDAVTVKDGYARNFSTPSDKVKRAAEADTQEFEACRIELEARQAEILANAKACQEKLDNQTITTVQRAGVDDRLLGSVTNVDIAAIVVASGIEVIKTSVRPPNGLLKAADEYELEVVLHTDAVAKITVAVVVAAVE